MASRSIYGASSEHVWKERKKKGTCVLPFEKLQGWWGNVGNEGNEGQMKQRECLVAGDARMLLASGEGGI